MTAGRGDEGGVRPIARDATDGRWGRASATQLTVVVPTRDSARTLEVCLASVRRQSVPVKLVVVGNASTDQTKAVVRRVADTVLDGGPERSAQSNAGWRAGHGEAVAFIDSDMRLDPAVAEEGLALLQSRPEVGASVLPGLDCGAGFPACRALEKRLYVGEAAVEAARAFRAAALAEVGGYDESLTGPKDWELSDRVLAGGWELARTTGHVWHDESRGTSVTSSRRALLRLRRPPLPHRSRPIGG